MRVRALHLKRAPRSQRFLPFLDLPIPSDPLFIKSVQDPRSGGIAASRLGHRQVEDLKKKQEKSRSEAAREAAAAADTHLDRISGF